MHEAPQAQSGWGGQKILPLGFSYITDTIFLKSGGLLFSSPPQLALRRSRLETVKDILGWSEMIGDEKWQKKDEGEISESCFIRTIYRKAKLGLESFCVMFLYVPIEHIPNEFPNSICVCDICKVHTNKPRDFMHV